LKNIFIKLILASNLIFSYNLIIEQNFGKIIYNEIEYESPFLGGFNKPKIQWADWNKDGLVDLFLLDEDGHIRYYINENQNFKLKTTNFLNFSNINWFYIYDFDYDFEYEIITSSYLFPGGVSYFDYIDEELVYISEIVNENNNYLDIDQSMIPTFSDIDGDEDLDLFSGNIIGTLNFFENKGLINNIPVFNLESNYWQEIYIVGQSRHGASAISFIDLDNDSDLDLSWGDYFQQSLYIIWNTGDIFNPVMDNDSIVTQFPFSSPVNTAGLNLPSFVDIDNDNDNDLFVTTLSGAYGYQLTNNFMYYENIDNQYSLRTNNFIETIDLLSDVNPKIIDIDNDGDLDLFIGTNYDPTSFPWIGKIIFYENMGLDSENHPIWNNNDNNNFLNVDLGNNLFPEFVDIDNDSDFDLFVGNYNGVIHYFENIGTANNYNFQYNGIVNGIDLQGYSSPEFIDIDSDEDYDLLIGCIDGNIYFYENIGDKYNFDFYLRDNILNNINVDSRSTILSIDFDLDNDYDLLIGSGNSNIFYYENFGNEFSPQFQLNNNFILPYTGKNVSIDYYNSCSYSGIISGISTGGMYFIPISNDLFGDINNDNILNIFDIIIFIESILKNSYSGLIDLNSDCIIDISDAIILINLILNT
tara:strand:+ start:13863 stop:15785 length:1923 start_codon:yes stop_codon:yes gene_type:complete